MPPSSLLLQKIFKHPLPRKLYILQFGRRAFLICGSFASVFGTDVSDQSFNIVDIKPDNMEELTKVVLRPLSGI
jgi:hypothetical protein